MKTTDILAPAPCSYSDFDGGCWQANLEALARYWPFLHQRILEYQPDDSGPPWIKDEPWSGVPDHLHTVPPEAKGLAFFIGLGLGHGPLLLQRQRPDISQIAILEPSFAVFSAALARVDLRPLLTAKQVCLFVGDPDWEAIKQKVVRVASLEDTHILRHLPSFQWRPEVYGPVDTEAYMMLNQLNASGSTTRKCGGLFMENRFALFTLLRHVHSLDPVRDLFKGRPAVLVAAGPSLTKSLPDLRRIVGRCVLIAADSALAPLLKAGIVPDFITTIDYQDLNFEKFAPFQGQEWPCSLVALVKTAPLIPKRFPAKHTFLAFADDQPQEWIMRALGIKTLTAACSSVAHLSLGLALTLGCDPIILLGQDLSYTNAVGDHAEGTIIMTDGLPDDREIFHRPAIGGGTMPTDRQFLSILKVFEDITATAPKNYINATSTGLRIAGTTEMPLPAAAARHCAKGLPVATLLDKALATSPVMNVDGLIQTGRNTLAAIKGMREHLHNAIRLAERATRDIAAWPPAKSAKIVAFPSLPEPIQELLARLDQLNTAIDRTESIWAQVVELTFPMLNENDQRRNRNDRLRDSKGYLPWLSAELERINTLNHDRLGVLNSYAAGLERLLDHLAAEQSQSHSASADDKARVQILLHLQAGDYALASRRLAAWPQAERPDAMFHLLSGHAKAGMLDFSGAMADWRQAISIDPTLHGQVLTLQERFADEWIDFAERYGNADEGGDNYAPLLPTWLARVAELFREQTHLPARAMALWERHRQRIELWLDAGQYQAATITLNAWSPLADRIPEAVPLQARLLAASGDLDAAIHTLEAASRRCPHQSNWLALLSRQLLAAQRYDRAIAILDRAVRLDPTHATIWAEIGDLLTLAHNYRDAILAYERCFLALPNHIDALCRMGDCYLAAKQPEAALVAFTATLAKDPGHSAAQLGLAKAQGVIRTQ